MNESVISNLLGDRRTIPSVMQRGIAATVPGAENGGKLPFPEFGPEHWIYGSARHWEFAPTSGVRLRPLCTIPDNLRECSQCSHWPWGLGRCARDEAGRAGQPSTWPESGEDESVIPSVGQKFSYIERGGFDPFWISHPHGVGQSSVHIGPVKTISCSEARETLGSLIDRVVADRAPIAITRQRGEGAVLVSESEWASIEERLYLLRSPANAARLLDAVRGQREGGGSGARGGAVPVSFLRALVSDRQV